MYVVLVCILYNWIIDTVVVNSRTCIICILILLTCDVLYLKSTILCIWYWILIKRYVTFVLEYFVNLLWIMVLLFTLIGFYLWKFFKVYYGFRLHLCIFHSLVPVTCPFGFGSWQYQIRIFQHFITINTIFNRTIFNIGIKTNILR